MLKFSVKIHRYLLSGCVQCKLPDNGRRSKHIATIFMRIFMYILQCFKIEKCICWSVNCTFIKMYGATINIQYKQLSDKLKLLHKEQCRLFVRNFKSSPTNGLKENHKHQTAVTFVSIMLRLALLEAVGKWEMCTEITDCIICRQ